MDQLINLVVERTGISTDQARTAINTVLSFLKDRLPEPVAGQLDKIAQTGKSVEPDDLAGQLGGLFGKK